MATLHSLAISRAHQKIARKFMVRNNLPNTKEAIVRMIEIASAAHAATTTGDDVGEMNGTKNAVSSQDRYDHFNLVRSYMVDREFRSVAKAAEEMIEIAARVPWPTTSCPPAAVIDNDKAREEEVSA